MVNKVLGDTGCVTALVPSSVSSLADCSLLPELELVDMMVPSETSSLDSVLLIGVSEVVEDDTVGVVVSLEISGVSVVTIPAETSESSVVKELIASITTGPTVAVDASTLGAMVVLVIGMVDSSVVTASSVVTSMSVVESSAVDRKEGK